MTSLFACLVWFFVFCLSIVFSITIRALVASSCLCFVHLLLLCCLRQDEGLWDDGSVTLAQLNKAEMNEILSKAQGMSTSQLRSEINKLEGASSRTTSLASSAARTQSLGGIVRGGQITEVSSRAGCRQRCGLRRRASRSEARVHIWLLEGTVDAQMGASWGGAA